MNKICETCDVRNRLNTCRGKNNEFKYCYRRSGNVEETSKDIFQFDTTNELKMNLLSENKHLDIDSLTIDWKYGHDNHTGLALCKYNYELLLKDYGNNAGIIEDYTYPQGWIYY